MRTSLLAILLASYLSACSSTSGTSGTSPSESASTDAQVTQIAAGVQDPHLRALFLELVQARRDLGDGKLEAARNAAGAWIGTLDDGPTPLSNDELAMLLQFGLVAESAGNLAAAERAAARVQFQRDYPGDQYLTLRRKPLKALLPGAIAASSLPKAPGVGGAIEDIEDLVPLDPAGGAKTDDGAKPVDAGAPTDSGRGTAPTPATAAELLGLLEQARTAFDRGDYAGAEVHLERILALAPNTPDAPGEVVREAQSLLAEIQLRRGELERAEALLRASLSSWQTSKAKSEPAVLGAFLRLTLLLVAQGRYLEAIALRDLVDAQRLGVPSSGPAGAANVAGGPPTVPFVGAEAGGADTGAIEAAWSAGDPRRARELSETSLKDVETAKGSSEEIRFARWLCAVFAVETGDYGRARELIALLLDGDALAGPVQGEQRSRVFALQERLARLSAQSRGAEEELYADWTSPGSRDDGGNGPGAWTPADEEAARAAFQKQRGEPSSPERETFDLAGSRAECARLRESCALHDATVVQRRIVDGLESDSAYGEAERAEALRDLAALYRVLGETAAAREVELRLMR